MPKIINFLEKNKFLIFIVLYLILRLFLLNINAAEWGDSYRILRATSYLENGSYPDDEKRPPLFSFLLLLKLTSDPILSSRILMLVLSFAVIGVFYLVLNTLNWDLSSFQKFLAVLFFSLNPLFIYWSIRIYADTLFLFWLLVGIFIFNLYLKKNSKFYLFILPLICALGILTRFEGYLLTAALFGGILFQSKKKVDSLLFLLGLGVLYILILLYPDFFHYKNPLTSSYVDEAGTRVIRLKEVFNFFTQFLFLLGNLFSIYFIGFNYKNVIKFFKQNLVILLSVGLHLALSFVWFAAVPRLFLPIVPFYIILLVISLGNFFEKTSKIKLNLYLKTFWKKENLHYLSLFLLVGSYFLGQYYLKLPFLLTSFRYILIVLILSTFIIYCVINHLKNLLFTLLIAGNIFWAVSYISLEKNTYRVLNNAVIYLKSTYGISGNILSNDISSISRYYFEKSFVYSPTLDSGRDFQKEINKNDIRFVLVTNEHNPDLSFTPSKYPYLTVIKEFREKVNGVEFFTIIAQVSNK